MVLRFIFLVLSAFFFVSTSVFAQLTPSESDTTIANNYFETGIKLIREAANDSAVANFTEGERIYERIAMQAHRQDLWERYIEYRNEVGYQLWRAGHVDAALPHNRMTLGICMENLGKNHVQYAHVLTQVGNVLADTGNDKDAKENYQKALDPYINLFGELHVYVAQAYGRLGDFILPPERL